MKINRLDWDSNFFGLRIGWVEIQSEKDGFFLESQRNFLKMDYDLIYVFSNHGLNFGAHEAKLVDEKIVYTLSEDFCMEDCPNVILWETEKGVTDELLHLALVSGGHSRFKLDERFPVGSYERLYSRWIEQSVSHSIASEVFCYMIDNSPKGLVTLDVTEGCGTVGLVAIHEDFQRKGIGTAMMRHVIHYAHRNQCRKLSVATQLKNFSACKLYEKSGFELESVTDVWHWWM